jgi:hypothetical protein
LVSQEELSSEIKFLRDRKLDADKKINFLKRELDQRSTAIIVNEDTDKDMDVFSEQFKEGHRQIRLLLSEIKELQKDR